jgi:hypothetical protein
MKSHPVWSNVLCVCTPFAVVPVTPSASRGQCAQLEAHSIGRFSSAATAGSFQLSNKPLEMALSVFTSDPKRTKRMHCQLKLQKQESALTTYFTPTKIFC